MASWQLRVAVGQEGASGSAMPRPAVATMTQSTDCLHWLVRLGDPCADVADGSQRELGSLVVAAGLNRSWQLRRAAFAVDRTDVEPPEADLDAVASEGDHRPPRSAMRSRGTGQPW